MLQCVNHTYNVCRELDQCSEQQIALTHVMCVTHVLCVASWINALIVCCVAVRVAVCVAVAVCQSHMQCVANSINALIVWCVTVCAAYEPYHTSNACHEIYEIYHTYVVFRSQYVTFNLFYLNVEVSWTS